MSEVTADQAAAAADDTGMPPPAPVERTAQETEYVILSRDEPAGSWKEQTKVKAQSSTSAIRKWIDGAPDPSGTYIAVPARSWHPVTVETETQTRVKFS
jgi:hypothetical protein